MFNLQLKNLSNLTALLFFIFFCVACGQEVSKTSSDFDKSNEVVASQSQPETKLEYQKLINELTSEEKISKEENTEPKFQDIEIQELTPDSESSLENIEISAPTLTYIGHASIKIVTSNGTVIYLDPNYDDDYLDEADYIFITHGHSDHAPHKNVKLAPNGTILTYKDVLHDGIYEKYDFGEVKLEAVAAANQNHDIRYCVGYLVSFDNITIYHAGDTSLVESMRNLSSKNIDYAFYPIDGIYNMDAFEATEVAEIVRSKTNIPIHELNNDTKLKSDNFTPSGRLIMKYGETIELKK